MCESGERETGRRPDGLPVGKPWPKGVSGNRKGRPKGLQALVRRRVGESGEKLVKRACELAFGFDIDPRICLAALVFLADRGWGKAPMAINHGLQAPGTVKHVVFGGRHLENGTLKEWSGERLEFQMADGAEPMRPLAIEPVTLEDIAAAHDDDDDQPTPTVGPEPEDPAESVWTAVEP